MDIEQLITEGYRVISLIDRLHRKTVVQHITKNKKEFYVKLEELKPLEDESNKVRIYSSLNKRNISKAIRLFKQRQLDNDYNGGDPYSFYTNLNRRFISALMDPTCRDTKYYLIDCDTELDTLKYENLINQDLILHKYNSSSELDRTHIITKCFDMKPFLNDSHIMRDALIRPTLIL